jgi:low temperature requirement protein LtrA
MSGVAEQESRVPPLLRDRSGVQRVTNIELFFDLVYVFAVTQLSHYLIGHSTVTGALQTGLLLAMVWLVWSYTTWVTNWLDPELMAVRLLLVVLMLISLAMSASLPRAFEDLGLWVGGAYALQQIGRSVFMVIALRGHPLEANFQRILAWCVVSSALALAGGLAHGNTRILLWLGAVCVDLLGGIVGFATPGLGRSRTSDWTIEGGHFAERCQAFILIALGESIIIIGTTLTDVKPVTVASVTSFVVSFAGSVALWWLYFDQSAGGGGGDDRQVGRPGPAGPFGVPPDPSGDGGGHHRLRGRRREGPGRPWCGRQHRLGVDDPGRPGAVPGRPRRLQAGGVARPVLAAAGRDRGAGPARPSRRRHSRPGPGRLHGRPGHRRRRQRPPAVATPPGGASAPGLARGTCPARGEESRYRIPQPPVHVTGGRNRGTRDDSGIGTAEGQPPGRGDEFIGRRRELSQVRDASNGTGWSLYAVWAGSAW